MTMTSRELGALRRRLIHEPKSFLVAELRTIGGDVGVPLGHLTKRAAAVEAILDAIGRPFDREAAAALRPVPVPLYEHDPRGVTRHLRRHAWVTRTAHEQPVKVRRTIPRRYRKAATLVPVTARQLVVARAALVRSGR